MSRGHDDTVTVFLGDLSRDVSKEEVEKTFGYYGKLASVWLSRSPSGFGFIDFEDHHDAADAVKALDGKMICGSRIRVEFSHGRGRSNRGGRSRRDSGSRSPRSRKAFSSQDVCYECGDRGHYAYDCEIRLKRQRRMKSTSRSRSPKRSTNGNSTKRDSDRRGGRNRSRSATGRDHSKSRSHSRSRSNSSSGSDSPVPSKQRQSRLKSKSPSQSRASR